MSDRINSPFPNCRKVGRIKPDRPQWFRKSGCNYLILLALASMAFWGIAMGQETVVLDFPIVPTGANLPEGLGAWPTQSNLGENSIEIPLVPVDNEASVLVTVMFLDAKGTNIQAKWVGSGSTSTILLENLSENLDGWNQRTFKIASQLLQEAGSLVLGSDANVQPVKRVTLVWTMPQPMFVGPEAQPLRYILSSSQFFSTADLSETGTAPLPDSVSQGLWTAPLQDGIQSLDNSVQFVIPIDSVPTAVVFRAKLFGLAQNQTESIQVNGQPAQVLSLSVPSLGGPGYYHTANGNIDFAGWRDAAVIIPASSFKAGDNTVAVTPAKGAYIKQAHLEISFEGEGSELNPVPLVDGANATPNSVLLP